VAGETGRTAVDHASGSGTRTTHACQLQRTGRERGRRDAPDVSCGHNWDVATDRAFPLSINVERRSDGSTLLVVGDMDLLTVDTLVSEASAVLGTAPGTLTLDLGGVAFCDSVGIAGLVRIRQLCDEAGSALRLVNLQRPVRRVIEITGLRAFLGVSGAAADDEV
jgi:anti-anti-sigma factor